METMSSGKTSNMISLLAGIGLMLAPFVLEFVNFSQVSWSSVITGLIVGTLAVYRMTSEETHVWTATVSLILGLWAILSPFVLNASSSTTAVWSGVIGGAIIAVFSVASIATSEVAVHRPREQRYEN
jgi:peptidoglycan/LPS O-acetylase OafA/YrhL